TCRLFCYTSFIFSYFSSFAFFSCFFFFNDTATTEIYTLSLHDALPISKLKERLLKDKQVLDLPRAKRAGGLDAKTLRGVVENLRSEEHTSELQSLAYLVCRLLLEKKKKNKITKNKTLYHTQTRYLIGHL